MTVSTQSVDLAGIGPLEVSVNEYGSASGRPFLILHGGAGPQSVSSPGALGSTRVLMLPSLSSGRASLKR